MQDDAVWSSTEDRYGAHLVATGGTSDLEKKSAGFHQGEQGHSSSISSDGSLCHGLAHQTNRVASVADSEPPEVRANGRQLLRVLEYPQDGIELDLSDGQEANVCFLRQFLSGRKVDTVVSQPGDELENFRELRDLTFFFFCQTWDIRRCCRSVSPA